MNLFPCKQELAEQFYKTLTGIVSMETCALRDGMKFSIRTVYAVSSKDNNQSLFDCRQRRDLYSPQRTSQTSSSIKLN